MNESNKKVCRQTTSFSDPTAKIFAQEVCVECKHEGEDWRIVQLKSNDEVWICISKPRLSVHGLAVGK